MIDFSKLGQEQEQEGPGTSHGSSTPLDPEFGSSKLIAARKKPKRNSDSSREPQYTNHSKKAKAQNSNRDLLLAHRNSQPTLPNAPPGHTRNKNQSFVNRQPYSSNFVKSGFNSDAHGQQ